MSGTGACRLGRRRFRQCHRTGGEAPGRSPRTFGGSPTMNQFTEAFKAITLREFFLESRLPEEFQAARVFSWAGGKLAWPLSQLVEVKMGVPEPAGPCEPGRPR